MLSSHNSRQMKYFKQSVSDTPRYPAKVMHGHKNNQFFPLSCSASSMRAQQNVHAKNLMSFILSTRKPKKNLKCKLVYSLGVASLSGDSYVRTALEYD